MGHVQFLNAADGAPIDGPTLQVRIGGERFRFLPHDRQLVYMLDTDSTKQMFWLYDLKTKNNRQIADFDLPGTRTFDITLDGKQIVFDRLRDNSDIVLIDLKKQN
jgi:Tol biopolymer transport system component